MKRTRIVIADDHTLLSDAIKNLLEPEFEIVGMFTDGQTLLDAAPGLMPDVIILDIGMPVMNGLNAGRRLKQVLPKVKLVYLTMHKDLDLAAEAFQWGASGYILKTSAASELVRAVREALRGGFYVTQLITKDMVGSFIQNFKRLPPPHELTLRQKEVLQLLVEGRPMKEVACMLNITPRTVAFHKYTMMEQLQVKSSAELIHYAINNLIVSSQRLAARPDPASVSGKDAEG
jgi:DNA-binding NarL/FixJ family response regulator